MFALLNNRVRMIDSNASARYLWDDPDGTTEKGVHFDSASRSFFQAPQLGPNGSAPVAISIDVQKNVRRDDIAMKNFGVSRMYVVL